jgi:hypothetical protein
VPIPRYDDEVMKRLVLLVALGACSKGSATANIDAPPQDSTPIDAAPYSHRIMIDGVDDFLSAEQFPTTSAGYGARVAWDADNLYIGYAGADLDPAAPETSTKWLFVYIDSDPGMPTGALVNETYTTQGATFPAGFRADFYVRWRCDEMFLALKQYNGATWTDGAAPPAARVGTFLEIAIPRASLGTSTQLSLVSWMINEKQNVESSYAGLYATNFTDGYAANLALTKYLKIDFTSTRDPNDAANQGP